MNKYWNLLLCSFLLVFTAACSGNSDDEPEGETGELTLISSATYIENNGTDQAVFTVLKGKKDVTAEAKIYQKKGSSFELLPSASFSSNRASSKDSNTACWQCRAQAWGVHIALL